MSLIKCPDCGKDICIREASCPHCGRPLTTEEIEVGTDLTGKKHRLYLVLGILVCSLGWILFSSEDKFSAHTGISFIVIGLIGYIVAKILIWWRYD